MRFVKTSLSFSQSLAAIRSLFCAALCACRRSTTGAFGSFGIRMVRSDFAFVAPMVMLPSGAILRDCLIDSVSFLRSMQSHVSPVASPGRSPQ